VRGFVNTVMNFRVSVRDLFLPAERLLTFQDAVMSIGWLRRE
jgi:hypothetical protein